MNASKQEAGKDQVNKGKEGARDQGLHQPYLNVCRKCIGKGEGGRMCMCV